VEVAIGPIANIDGDERRSMTACEVPRERIVLDQLKPGLHAEVLKAAVKFIAKQ